MRGGWAPWEYCLSTIIWGGLYFCWRGHRVDPDNHAFKVLAVVLVTALMAWTFITL